MWEQYGTMYDYAKWYEHNGDRYRETGATWPHWYVRLHKVGLIEVKNIKKLWMVVTTVDTAEQRREWRKFISCLQVSMRQVYEFLSIIIYLNDYR